MKESDFRRKTAMVKVILQLYPVIPAADEQERQHLRPIGRNVDRYQETLAGWHDVVIMAEVKPALDECVRYGERLAETAAAS